jgi:hypothetical protein
MLPAGFAQAGPDSRFYFGMVAHLNGKFLEP